MYRYYYRDEENSLIEPRLSTTNEKCGHSNYEGTVWIDPRSGGDNLF